MGAFGENFTTDGLNEDSVHIGDRISIGSAEFVVTQPRLPCYKLDIRFESDGMVKRFLASRRSGFYLAVVREGSVGAGEEITMLSRHPNSISVSEINRLYIAKEYAKEDLRLLQMALSVEALPESWKEFLGERATRLSA
jgi:MOSC domain-containing protein YiiM